ncbi:DUF6506 family protein [Hydrogenophaga sp. BPS33]|uniref:DUF6506 family protein n=1 Tax=Hydrogenophaga sp. BPS33 TaxID=2651974 RepID=UPI00131F7EA7|nr:DUF6506 family protein [Hydrogenophaga sp. BPS33]QHE86222.1 hypothetical protein F9K07_15565 [Hydrogenophaga sp. BPS33]
MALKAAFIFLAPGANPAEHRSVVRTPEVELTTIGAPNYEQAELVVRSLLDQGIVAVELCGGFGTAGTARIAAAAGSGVAVGVVRFDIHPGLGGKSGDQVFGLA